MREIKFRFWKNEEMTHWEELAYLDICDWLNQENIIAMQFTGLLDKNGKEIYEGDIVTKDGKVNAEVVFIPPSFQVVLKVSVQQNDLKGYGFSDDRIKIEKFTAPLDTDCEIIGNIYENLELLQLKEI